MYTPPVILRKGDRFSIAYAKWSKHTSNMRDRFYEVQSPLVGNIDITFTKHFIQRIVERAYNNDEESIIRRMFYHTLNTRLCELLFWYYSNCEKDIMIRKDNRCIIITRGSDGCSIVVRTFYKQTRNVKEENFFYIEI